jgi:Putative phage tail protein
MPAQLTFFDMSISVTAPLAYVPVPVTTGPNFQPGDVRLFLQRALTSSGDFTVTPPGYTAMPTPGSGYRMCFRRMQPGDTDTFVQYSTVVPFTSGFSTALLTVRGVSPTNDPALGVAAAINSVGNTRVTLPATSSTGGSAAMPTSPSANFPVPVGAALIWTSNWTGTGATNQTGCTWGAPTGWASLVATDGSGATYTPFGAQMSSAVFAKAFSSAGSVGAFSIQYGAENNAQNDVICITIPSAVDVSVTAGTAPRTATTATAATFSVSTAVTPTMGSATTTTTATTAYNPLYGIWLSDPITLTGDPVTGSVTRWVQSTPATGSTVTVQTSINNGATWDLATNNGAIPRLLVGDTTTAGVLVRVILTRVLATDTAPEVLPLEIQVSANASVDELVPVGHGMIDKTTVNAVGGTQGTGSVTNVASSSAVIGRGGGQTGGGTSIKVHVTDLSGSIKRNVWAMPYTVPSGLNYGAAAQAMVVNRLPDQTAFAISTTTRVTPLLVYGMQQGGDPWQDIQDLATAIGYEAFFDAKGVFVFRPVPDPSVGDAVWAFDEDNIPLVAEATRELSNEQTFNHVIVVGQSTSSSNPVTAEALDNNPSSPTYILGPYGEVTERLTFSTITTQDQAQAAANALLLNSLGGADTVTLECVPQPALEPGDIVKINCGDVNVDGNYMINSMTTSLSPADPQQLVCFRQSTS